MPGPRAGTTLARSNRRWFWVFVAPFLVGLLVFVYVPLLWSLALSLFDARNTVTPTRFVGLDNYAYLLSDRLFLSSLGTFIVFALFIVPVTFACSLALALLLQRITVLRAFFRSVFFIPTAVSYVIAAMVWRMSFFNGARFGLVNTLLVAVGQQPVNWLGGENDWYWFVLVSLRLWLQVGFYMILFIAGLNQIDPQLYEAAALDGAGAWKRFWYVTFPLLRPTAVAVSMLLLFNAFQAFDEFYNTLNTAGGYPPYARPPLVYLYLITFGGGSQDLGVGSAGTMILTLVILVFSFLQNRLLAIGADK
ncbi:sugar ABC transporter permease [Propioniciclava coleopterorum]|uniref:Sugar ABC transporter permease n=1 Tax=Propioniciclava coleopterorum TaxID=2714937 RepID=A0A6G7Y5N2_9ACTN|nr:sugar ABC transporter permease [Propioniciclava coleopterorum]QIK72132.1 sugar ABC transporter permease [Propioniciclava coleopterorum]